TSGRGSRNPRLDWLNWQRSCCWGRRQSEGPRTAGQRVRLPRHIHADARDADEFLGDVADVENHCTLMAASKVWYASFNQHLSARKIESTSLGWMTPVIRDGSFHRTQQRIAWNRPRICASAAAET